jgi:hypothetical protein
MTRGNTNASVMMYATTFKAKHGPGVHVFA